MRQNIENRHLLSYDMVQIYKAMILNRVLIRFDIDKSSRQNGGNVTAMSSMDTIPITSSPMLIDSEPKSPVPGQSTRRVLQNVQNEWPSL